MVFYQLDGTVTEENSLAESKFSTDKGHSFLCTCHERQISFCIALERADTSELQKLQEELCRKYLLSPESLQCKELTIDEAHHLLARGEANGKILSADTIFTELELGDFNSYPAQGLSESMIKAPLSFEEAQRACDKFEYPWKEACRAYQCSGPERSNLPHSH